MIISYAATESLIPTGISVTGTNLSANTSDYFQTTTSGALNVFTTDYWIEVAGFTNPENNGWFQVGTAPNAFAREIDPDGVLVTEAAGNSITMTEYTHGYNQQYELEFNIQQLDRTSQSNILGDNISYSGKREKMVSGLWTYYDVTTSEIEEADMAAFREMMDSIADQTFQCSLNNDPIDVNTPYFILDSNSYTESRVGQTTYFTVSFRLFLME